MQREDNGMNRDLPNVLVLIGNAYGWALITHCSGQMVEDDSYCLRIWPIGFLLACATVVEGGEKADRGSG